eukprot:7343688-Prymnesium_polylepis.1
MPFGQVTNLPTSKAWGCISGSIVGWVVCTAVCVRGRAGGIGSERLFLVAVGLRDGLPCCVSQQR